MTIASTTTKQTYSCNGVTVAFDFTFPVFSGSDLLVIQRTIATGAEATLSLNTDYTTSATNNDYSSGGRVTLTSAPSSAYQLIVMRNISATQETVYDEGDAFPAATHEQAIDKLTMLQQQQAGGLNRALRVPKSDSDVAELPNAVSRAEMYLAFDENGDPIAATALPDTTDMENVLLGSRYATLAAAVTAAGSTPSTIIIDATLPIGGNVTVPATCALRFLRGGSISGSDTLTINGPLEAGLWQIFGSSLTVAGSPKVEALNARWFGAVGDGVTDDRAAIQSAVATANAAYVATGKPCAIFFPPGSYASTTVNSINLLSGVRFVGAGAQSSAFVDLDATALSGTPVVRKLFKWSEGASVLYDVSFENLGFVGNERWQAGDFDYGSAIWARVVDNFSAVNCRFENFMGGSICLNMKNDAQGQNVLIQGCSFSADNYYPFIAVYCSNGKNLRILNNDFRHIAISIALEAITGESGLLQNVLIQGNSIRDGNVSEIDATNHYLGVQLQYDGDGTGYAENVQIVDNFFSGSLENHASSADISLTAAATFAYFSYAAATDEGEGKVGLVMASNPFTAGQTVTISGTTNYNGTFTVESGGSSTKLIITATYIAETIPSSALALLVLDGFDFSRGYYRGVVIANNQITNGMALGISLTRVTGASVHHNQLMFPNASGRLRGISLLGTVDCDVSHNLFRGDYSNYDISAAGRYDQVGFNILSGSGVGISVDAQSVYTTTVWGQKYSTHPSFGINSYSTRNQIESAATFDVRTPNHLGAMTSRFQIGAGAATQRVLMVQGFGTGEYSAGDVTATAKSNKIPVYAADGTSLIGYLQLYAGS
jgi:hypothetical protein